MAEKFGKFTLLRRIAIGGMGEIFLAQERGFGGVERSLVVKRLLPQLGQSEEFVTMFLDEGRIAAQLSHPNIVQLHEVGEIDGRYYLAMEYVDGLSLAELIVRLAKLGAPACGLDVALPIAHSLAAALGYAHSRRDAHGESLAVVHRDVTPQNVLLSRLGGVKLTDFGIATAANKVHVTVVGKVKGKLAYMAPEQARGERVDGRADIFALGILMYEMTTGVHPFLDATQVVGDQPDAVQALVKIITSPPLRPSQHDPLYPNDLETLVMRCLEKDPADRPASATIVERKVEELMERRQIVTGGRALAEMISRICPPTDRPPTMSGFVLAKPGQGTLPMADAPEQAMGPRPPSSPSRPKLAPPPAGAAVEAPLITYADDNDHPVTEMTAPYSPGRPQGNLRIVLSAILAAIIGAGLTLTVVYVPDWRGAHPRASALGDPNTLAPRAPDASVPVPPPVPEVVISAPDDAVAPEPDSQDGGAVMEFTVGETLQRRPGGLIAFHVYPWAWVLIDGRQRGLLPMAPVPVSAGPHRVTLRCGEGRDIDSRTLTVHVPSGGRATVTHTFQRCR